MQTLSRSPTPSHSRSICIPFAFIPGSLRSCMQVSLLSSMTESTWALGHSSGAGPALLVSHVLARAVAAPMLYTCKYVADEEVRKPPRLFPRLLCLSALPRAHISDISLACAFLYPWWYPLLSVRYDYQDSKGQFYNWFAASRRLLGVNRTSFALLSAFAIAAMVLGVNGALLGIATTAASILAASAYGNVSAFSPNPLFDLTVAPRAHSSGCGLCLRGCLSLLLGDHRRGRGRLPGRHHLSYGDRPVHASRLRHWPCGTTPQRFLYRVAAAHDLIHHAHRLHGLQPPQLRCLQQNGLRPSCAFNNFSFTRAPLIVHMSCPVCVKSVQEQRIRGAEFLYLFCDRDCGACCLCPASCRRW